MIRQECFPGLRAGTYLPFEQTRDRALGDVDAECPPLTMNSRRTPQGIRDSHLSNELTDLLINRWTAITTLRTSRPAAAKPVPMPAHNGVGSNDHQRRTPVLPAYRQGDPEESVAGLQRDSLLDAFDRCPLLAQGHLPEAQLHGRAASAPSRGQTAMSSCSIRRSWPASGRNSTRIGFGEGQPVLGRLQLETEMRRPTAPPQPAAPSSLGGQGMGHRRDEMRPEAAALRARILEVVFFNQAREERLRQVVGIRRRITAPPHGR